MTASSSPPGPATDDGPGPQPSSVRSVAYNGADLDSARGPGLGCFRFQLILLGVLIVLTPISVVAGAPDWLSAALLFVTLGLLLVAGQTIIFLLRLVAADRRGRRRPLASATRTVGEIEDAAAATTADAGAGSPAAGSPDDDPRRQPDADGPAEGDGRAGPSPEGDQPTVRQ